MSQPDFNRFAITRVNPSITGHQRKPGIDGNGSADFERIDEVCGKCSTEHGLVCSIVQFLT